MGARTHNLGHDPIFVRGSNVGVVTKTIKHRLVLHQHINPLFGHLQMVLGDLQIMIDDILMMLGDLLLVIGSSMQYFH